MELANEICQAAATLSGSEKTLYESLAVVVAELMPALLPKGTSVDSCRTSVVYAGAFMLLSFAQSLDENELAGFDAGTLKLSFRERNDSFAQVAKQIMAPWCHDPSAFCGVRA